MQLSVKHSHKYRAYYNRKLLTMLTHRIQIAAMADSPTALKEVLGLLTSLISHTCTYESTAQEASRLGSLKDHDRSLQWRREGRPGKVLPL